MFYKMNGKTVAWIQSEVDFLVKPKEVQDKQLLASNNIKIRSPNRSLIKSCLDRDYGWPEKVRSRI